MVEFKQKTGISKKTGKEFTAYVFCVDDYESPFIFPSKIDLEYIYQHLED